MNEKVIKFLNTYGYYMSDEYDLVMDFLIEDEHRNINYVYFKKSTKHCVYDVYILRDKLKVSSLVTHVMMSSEQEIPEYIANIEKIYNRNKIINDLL